MRTSKVLNQRLTVSHSQNSLVTHFLLCGKLSACVKLGLLKPELVPHRYPGATDGLWTVPFMCTDPPSHRSAGHQLDYHLVAPH
jgi:hypothetical protein